MVGSVVFAIRHNLSAQKRGCIRCKILRLRSCGIEAVIWAGLSYKDFEPRQ